MFSGPATKTKKRALENERPHKGAFMFLAERVGLSLRDQACGYAAAPVEQGPHPQPHSARKQNGPTRGPFHFLAERVAIFAHPRESEEV